MCSWEEEEGGRVKSADFIGAATHMTSQSQLQLAAVCVPDSHAASDKHSQLNWLVETSESKLCTALTSSEKIILTYSTHSKCS